MKKLIYTLTPFLFIIPITGCQQQSNEPPDTKQSEEFQTKWKLKEATVENCKQQIQLSARPAQVLDLHGYLAPRNDINPAASVDETSTGYKYAVEATLSGHNEKIKYYCYTGKSAQVLDLQRDTSDLWK